MNTELSDQKVLRPGQKCASEASPHISFESARPLDSLDFSFFLSLSLLIYKTESKLRDEKGLSQTRFLNEQPRFILHLVGT